VQVSVFVSLQRVHLSVAWKVPTPQPLLESGLVGSVLHKIMFLLQAVAQALAFN